MERQAREGAAHPRGQAQILNDHAVHGHFVEQGQGGAQVGELAAFEQGVERHVDLAPEIVGVGDDLAEGVVGEVGRVGPRGEAVEPQINRVRAIGEGGDRGVEGARGRKQLGQGRGCGGVHGPHSSTRHVANDMASFSNVFAMCPLGGAV